MGIESQTEDRFAAWLALLQAQAAVTDGVEAELLAECGLPLAWHEVLVRLAHADRQGMRMQDLARAVLLSKSGLTRLADRMETAHLIERRACETDRRVTYLALTAAGRRKLKECGPVFRRAVGASLAAPLSREELATLGALLVKVAEAPGAAGEEDCAPAFEERVPSAHGDSG